LRGFADEIIAKTQRRRTGILVRLLFAL